MIYKIQVILKGYHEKFKKIIFIFVDTYSYRKDIKNYSTEYFFTNMVTVLGTFQDILRTLGEPRKR